MLSGTMYPKKTYGKSLFIGEFKHAVGAVAGTSLPDEHAISTAKKDEPVPATLEEHEVQDGATSTDEVNVSRTLTYEVQDSEEKQKGDEIKLIWKSSTSASKPSQSLASKAFFTPSAKEQEGNDLEQVVDLPVAKEDSVAEAAELNTKTTKKKKASGLQPASLSTRKLLLQRPSKFPTKSRANAKQQDSKVSEAPNIHEDAESASKKSEDKGAPHEKENIEKTAEEMAELKDEEQRQNETLPKSEIATSEHLDEKKEEDKNMEQSETASSDHVEEEKTQEESVQQSETASSEHTEFSMRDYSSPERKDIVIKPIDFPSPTEGEEDSTKIAEEPLPSTVLEPNAVADIKRDLAEKGIISLPPELTPSQSSTDHNLPTNRGSGEYSQNTDDEDTGSSYSRDEDDDDDDINIGQSPDFSEEKLDRKEGFKTNKSFEIRRLQAKAEREREEKKKAKFGRRFSRLAARNDHFPRTHQDHSTRIPLKSALKPSTPPDGKNNPLNHYNKEISPRQSKSRTSVRIREPEYDYQEYTDVELESDSGDSIRPNTSLSFSEFSFPSDASSDSSSLGTNAGDDAFRELPDSDEVSLDSEDMHQIYDEIDNLSPSRAGQYGARSVLKSRESRRERIESGTSRVTRSSLHLRVGDYNQLSHNPQQYLKPYHDKPLHLFDAMRYEVPSSEEPRISPNDSRMTKGQKGEVPGRKQKRTISKFAKEDGHHRKKHRYPQHTSSRVPVSMESVVYPMNGNAAVYSKKEWKERVAKFFETSKFKGSSLKRTTDNATDDDLESGSTTTRTKRFKGCLKRLDYSEMSFRGRLFMVAIPTLTITVALLLIIAFATNIL